MKYYIIAGEASGDLHGSNLIKAIFKNDPAASIQCWGGDLMQSAGGHLVKHYRSLAFMGFVEVLMNLRTILSNISFCKLSFLNPILISLSLSRFGQLLNIKYLIYIHTHRLSLVSKIETKKKQRAEALCLVTTCITC